MQSAADKVIEQVCLDLPTTEMLQEHKPIFGDRTEFLQIGLSAIMKHACPIRRKGLAKTRADAIEIAFDHALAKVTRKQATRIGEVRLNPVDGVAEALCFVKEIGRSRGVRVW